MSDKNILHEYKGRILLFTAIAVTAILSPLFIQSASAVELMQSKDLGLPMFSNRDWIWVTAQLHINFAAFILGTPIFIVLCEYIGVRTKDPRYERLAHEITKVTAVCYSLTALTGGFFAIMLIGLYPDFTTYLFGKFFWIIVLLYPILFILETIILYIYIYSWEPLKDRKGLHITIGVFLNIIGITTLLVMDIPASYMNSPVSGAETLWENVNNFTWMPLNYHRLVGNITFGGFVAGFVAAFMFLMSESEEERAYYDWQGFIGNMIGTFAILFLPFMGYIYAHEFYAFDAGLGMYMMSDRLSMFFVVQGVLVGVIFISSNYYIWLSTIRIEGGGTLTLPIIKKEVSRYMFMKFNFVVLFFCSAVWLTPRHFMATMIEEANTAWYPMIGELPTHLGFMALMPAKNTAAFLIIFLTLVNYLLYRAAISKGKITWGKINPVSQYVLILLAFSITWLMGLMGAVRELVRKNWHVYKDVMDTSSDSFTPQLSYATKMISEVTLLWMLIITFIIWVTLMMGKKKPAKEAEGGV
ncbi:MAG: cytochrome ubiquinol oxidase subunit I [Nitrospinae bacterium]|nr:cytochrome ubiquinol oxidase subunit I [Nitrospinota bacterium]